MSKPPSKSIATALFALAVGLMLPPSTAGADTWDEVEFVGSGWGHGVGMSQYGAYAMAKEGHTYSSILSHYYQGTQIGNVDPTTSLWVNLERNRPILRFEFDHLTPGQPGADVMIEWDGVPLVAESGASVEVIMSGVTGCKVSVTNPGEQVVVMDDPTNCSFDFTWYDWENVSADPTTKVTIEGCALADWNDGPTRWVPCQYAHGMLHLRSGPIDSKNPQTGWALDLSAEMLLDDYVLGISEMPYYWTQSEALKVQAVAARSYAEAKRILRGNPATNSCDGWCHVRDTAVDQRYVGWGHSNAGSWLAAANSTASEVVVHPDSPIGVITAFYSSSTGGATEFGHEIGYSSSPVEWLTSVDDSWAVDGTVWNPNASWSVVHDAAHVASRVGLDTLSSVEVIETRPGSGSARWVEFRGVKSGSMTSVVKSGGWTDNEFGLKSQYFDVSFRAPGDEMFFYRATDGDFAYYDTNPDASLGSPILTGSGYSVGWSSITDVDLDGDTQGEMFFYRETDGAFRYYEINANGQLGTKLHGGLGYSTGWSSITAVDLDGDGRDEMFFYRETDGAFRYYRMNANGQLGTKLQGGLGYSTGWSSITAVDLDGDAQDEMFFYRPDRTYRYYNVQPDGSLGVPIRSGTYANVWTSIASIDLDGRG